uniref:Asp23/Gls24 family envelope stress response protein n=1 Tax=Streptomyces corallincola TaxID=2851888 RepID=UPI001FEA2C4E|nr:Asp23/Gls24 family envelope stress response protein [Streptomyces corallincola]
MTTRIHPPESPHPDDEQLPCGRLLSVVWTEWEEGTADGHTATCAHCLRATAELEDLEAAVRQVRDETDDLAAYDATPLTRRVMDVVGLELRPGRPLPLGEPDEDLWVMESVAARTLRAAADQMPGVRAGSCRISPAEPTGPDRSALPLAAPQAVPRVVRDSDRIAVQLDIRAPLTTPDLPALADEVRERVRLAADGRLGLNVVSIDIRITDLTDPPDDMDPQHMDPQHMDPQHMGAQHTDPQHMGPDHMGPDHMGPHHIGPPGIGDHHMGSQHMDPHPTEPPSGPAPTNTPHGSGEGTGP